MLRMRPTRLTIVAATTHRAGRLDLGLAATSVSRTASGKSSKEEADSFLDFPVVGRFKEVLLKRNNRSCTTKLIYIVYYSRLNNL
jgi:hypothetical protein